MTSRLLFLVPLSAILLCVSSCDRDTARSAKEKKALAQMELDAAVARAQAAARARAAAEAEETTRPKWRVLFDGSSLKNWETIDYAGHGTVELKDGAVSIGQGATLSGVRYTGGNLPKTDYEIVVEARRIMGNDFFCCLTFPFREKHATLVVGGWGGSVVGISSINNMDAYDNSTMTVREFDDGRWYSMRLRATENRIQAWIDDEQVVSTNVRDKEVSMRFGEIEDSVPLAVSTFAVKGEMRDLRLRELTPAEIAASEKLNEEDEY